MEWLQNPEDGSCADVTYAAAPSFTTREGVLGGALTERHFQFNSMRKAKGATNAYLTQRYDEGYVELPSRDRAPKGWRVVAPVAIKPLLNES